MDYASRQRRLGEILVARGLLTEAELATALAEQEGSGRMFGEVVVSLGLLTSSAVADALGEQRGWTPRSKFELGERLDPHREPLPPTDDEPQAVSSSPAIPPLPPVSPATPLPAPDALHPDPADADEELAALRAALVASEQERQRLRREIEQLQAEPTGRFEEDRHLLFVPTSAGYRIIERHGAAPEFGATVELAADHASRSYLVVKRARAPFPESRRCCAYLLPL